MKGIWKKWGMIQLIALSSILIFESCCRQNAYLFGDAMVSGYLIGENVGDMPSDTIDGPFAIEVLYTSRTLEASVPSLVPHMMATSCDFTPNNPIIPESFSLTCDAALYGVQDTLSAYTNLVTLDSLAVESSGEFSQIRFEFNQGFLEQYSFADGEHQFFIQGQTTNDVQLLDTLALYFDL